VFVWSNNSAVDNTGAEELPSALVLHGALVRERLRFPDRRFKNDAPSGHIAIDETQ
jgi:hypothetical protein